MKGVMRSPAIAAPLARPMSPPAATPAATTAAGLQPRWIRSAPTTLVSAMAEPTDRSMPPLMMTMVIPSEPIATITVWVKIILKL